MPVNSVHPEYRKYACRWDLVRSIIENDAKHWIRVVDKADPERSLQYKEDAILTNFTALTKSGLVGLAFRRDPEVNLPTELDYFHNDANGEGFNLFQLTQKIVGDVLQSGRHGILVDYPPTESPLSKRALNDSGNTATFKTYCAEAIINWNTVTIRNKRKLSLIVLKEDADSISEDGFSWVQKIRYRVLRLNENLNYVQEVWEARPKKDFIKDEYILTSSNIPTKANGQLWDEIPFVFIGSENNNADIDHIPLYDLATVNRGHYRNSADYEESIHICGQPTVFLATSMSKEVFDEFNPNGIKLGVRSGHNLGENGRAELLQANANQLVAQAMLEKIEQALAIGARLIAPPGGRETAEAARMRFASQNSALSIVVTNISIGLEQALTWASMFMMKEEVSDDAITFKLTTQFYDETADPNLLNAMQMLLDRGILAKSDLREYGRRTSIIQQNRTDEDIDAEAEMADPLGGGLISDNTKRPPQASNSITEASGE